MFVFVFVFVFVLGFVIIQRTIHSPYGQVLKAIKQNEPRAVSLGYNVDRYKLLAFVISAGLAGLAGSVKTVVFQLASLNDAHWHMSGEVILMTLLGGTGTLLGPGICRKCRPDRKSLDFGMRVSGCDRRRIMHRCRAGAIAVGSGCIVPPSAGKGDARMNT